MYVHMYIYIYISFVYLCMHCPAWRFRWPAQPAHPNRNGPSQDASEKRRPNRVEPEQIAFRTEPNRTEPNRWIVEKSPEPKRIEPNRFLPVISLSNMFEVQRLKIKNNSWTPQECRVFPLPQPSPANWSVPTVQRCGVGDINNRWTKTPMNDKRACTYHCGCSCQRWNNQKHSRLSLQALLSF